MEGCKEVRLWPARRADGAPGRGYSTDSFGAALTGQTWELTLTAGRHERA